MIFVYGSLMRILPYSKMGGSRSHHRRHDSLVRPSAHGNAVDDSEKAQLDRFLQAFFDDAVVPSGLGTLLKDPPIKNIRVMGVEEGEPLGEQP